MHRPYVAVDVLDGAARLADLVASSQNYTAFVCKKINLLSKPIVGKL